jgi:hypothetical protein
MADSKKAKAPLTAGLSSKRLEWKSGSQLAV